jgi:hypothetical protein
MHPWKTLLQTAQADSGTHEWETTKREKSELIVDTVKPSQTAQAFRDITKLQGICSCTALESQQQTERGRIEPTDSAQVESLGASVDCCFTLGKQTGGAIEDHVTLQYPYPRFDTHYFFASLVETGLFRRDKAANKPSTPPLRTSELKELRYTVTKLTLSTNTS